MRIGEKIKDIRKRAGLTQEELAKQVGVSTMTIRRYESNERICPRPTYTKILKVLDISEFPNIDLSTVPLKVLLAEIERRCNK